MTPLRWGLLLFGLWLAQWAHLAVVGLDTGLWDMTFTFAEDRLKPHQLRDPVVLQGYREAVARAEQLLPVDGRLARSYHDLGALLWLSGRGKEGRVYLRRALEIFEQTDGPDSTWVGMVCWRLGHALLNEPGHREEGVAMLERAESNLVRGRGELDPAALQVSKILALQLRDPVRAARLLRQLPDTPMQLDGGTRGQLQDITREKPATRRS